LAVCCGERVPAAEPLEWGLRAVEGTFELPVELWVGDRGLGGQTHDRLEKVVIEPHEFVELVEQACLSDGIEAAVAQVGADQSKVLLLDEAIVVLVERAAAGDSDTGHLVSPEAEQVVVEEFGAIVGVDLADGEGDAAHDALGGILHHPLAVTQHSSLFAPVGRSLREDEVATSVSCTVHT